MTGARLARRWVEVEGMAGGEASLVAGSGGVGWRLGLGWSAAARGRKRVNSARSGSNRWMKDLTPLDGSD